MPRDERRREPRRKPQQVRAELTRGRILDAAAHIFTEYGYAAGTTNRIAEAARVSIGSLYQYFPSKDAILAELMLRHIDEDALAPDTSGRPLDQVVRGFVRRTIDQHRLDPRLLRIMVEEAPLTPDLLDKLVRYDEKRTTQLRASVADHPDVRVTDLDAAARLAVSAIELVTHNLMAEPNPMDPELLENELVAMVTRYLRG
jgi:AcrR family transcriptional regulator